MGKSLMIEGADIEEAVAYLNSMEINYLVRYNYPKYGIHTVTCENTDNPDLMLITKSPSIACN